MDHVEGIDRVPAHSLLSKLSFPRLISLIFNILGRSHYDKTAAYAIMTTT